MFTHWILLVFSPHIIFSLKSTMQWNQYIFKLSFREIMDHDLEEKRLYVHASDAFGWSEALKQFRSPFNSVTNRPTDRQSQGQPYTTVM